MRRVRNSKCVQRKITLAVILRLTRVYDTVNFDYEPRARAIEIRDEAADHLLSAEVQTQCITPQRLPEHAFARRHLAPKPARQLQLGRVYFLSAGDVHFRKDVGDSKTWGKRTSPPTPLPAGEGRQK